MQILLESYVEKDDSRFLYAIAFSIEKLNCDKFIWHFCSPNTKKLDQSDL